MARLGTDFATDSIGEETVSFLYANPDAFNDVTKGRNPGTKLHPHYGVAAIKGWDAASGLGTPNFAALAALI